MCAACGTTHLHGGVVIGRQGAPDPRRTSGRFFEAVGHDYASPVVRQASTLMRPLMQTNPLMNQQSTRAPATSPDGQVLHRASGVIREMNPLFYGHRYRGFVGVFVVQNNKPLPIIDGNGTYDGILPMALQPKINKPLPYSP